jgi:hypothetical protein
MQSYMLTNSGAVGAALGLVDLFTVTTIQAVEVVASTARTKHK